MRRTLPLILALALFSHGYGQTTAPAPRAQRVLIMSIDGGRPDVLLRANTPNLRALCADGSFTFWARTTELSVTLPSHASMITGVTPEKHGITFNKDVPEEELFYPEYPTIFELAKKQGLSTALAAGKSKFVALCRPGSVDHAIVPPAKQNYTDLEVAQQAANGIREHRPQVMLVHFAGGDRAGHAIGWGSRQQITAMEDIDAGVGKLIQTLKKEGLYESTLIILTADHGGAARSHGKDDPRSRHIPWIAVGPGIRKNFDLTIFRDLVVNTEDTFATACAFLDITPAGDIDGKPITEMIEGAELMQDATTKPAVSSAK
ncbi:MAG TPA: ectonucleotide pyrophosphatase/phosphodiesterase [Tepidisphaeraceae bacterium]|nr:ectonucleotide pyrophosphatase/phosphodiesterase [Tepidisphaeraceae bacterium]